MIPSLLYEPDTDYLRITGQSIYSRHGEERLSSNSTSQATMEDFAAIEWFRGEA